MSANEIGFGWVDQAEEDRDFEAGAEVYEHAVARLEAEREAKAEAAYHAEMEREAEEEDRRRYPGGRCFSERAMATIMDGRYVWWAGPRCETAEEAAILF